MSVRIIIVLLALPLFLLLAAVNSLLLYRGETREMEAGLRGEALAAAVTVGEFARQSPDPFRDLARPGRRSAVHLATARIPGLDALYLVHPGGRTLNLLDKPIPTPRHDAVSLRAEVLGTWRDSRGHLQITAMAPAGAEMVVVADIDAEPLAQRAFHLKRLSIALVGGSVTLAILLGLIIARRVTREFRRTRALIEARGAGGTGDELRIREVRDLRDAVRLIEKSVADELGRLDDVDAGVAEGLALIRTRHFPDISIGDGRLTLSVRMLPKAPAGCFHIARSSNGGHVVAMGEIAGEPAAALAQAIALRDHLASSPADGFEAHFVAAAPLFGVSRHRLLSWHDDNPGDAAALDDAGGAVAGYARRNPDLDAATLTGDLASLFPDAAIVAAARPA